MLSSNLSTADSVTRRNAAPDLARGGQFKLAELLKKHETGQVDIPTLAVRLFQQINGNRGVPELMELLEVKFGEHPNPADVARVIGEILAEDELAQFDDEVPYLAATGPMAQSALNPALAATDQPQSGADSEEGFDLDIVTQLNFLNKSMIFEQSEYRIYC